MLSYCISHIIAFVCEPYEQPKRDCLRVQLYRSPESKPLYKVISAASYQIICCFCTWFFFHASIDTIDFWCCVTCYYRNIYSLIYTDIFFGSALHTLFQQISSLCPICYFHSDVMFYSICLSESSSSPSGNACQSNFLLSFVRESNYSLFLSLTYL